MNELYEYVKNYESVDLIYKNITIQLDSPTKTKLQNVITRKFHIYKLENYVIQKDAHVIHIIEQQESSYVVTLTHCTLHSSDTIGVVQNSKICTTMEDVKKYIFDVFDEYFELQEDFYENYDDFIKQFPTYPDTMPLHLVVYDVQQNKLNYPKISDYYSEYVRGICEADVTGE